MSTFYGDLITDPRKRAGLDNAHLKQLVAAAISQDEPHARLGSATGGVA